MRSREIYLGPRGEDAARARGLVEVDHAAACGGCARMRPVRLVAPVVEGGDVPPALLGSGLGVGLGWELGLGLGPGLGLGLGLGLGIGLRWG